MEIHFLINEKSINNMTWEEFETFEQAQEGDMKLYRLRPILARFMTNGNDLPMVHKDAMKILGTLPVSKIKETIELFMGTLKNGTIPKANGSESKSQSEQTSADSPSLDGSQP